MGTIIAKTNNTTITVEIIFFILGLLMFIMYIHLFNINMPQSLLIYLYFQEICPLGEILPYWEIIVSMVRDAWLRLISSICTVMSIL